MADTRDNDSKTAATGVGAVVGGAAEGVASGASAGAAVRGMTGPVGAPVGAAVGAVVGAVAGRSLTKADPAVEDAYWRDNYSGRPYIASDATFDDYGSAYRHGVEAYSRNPNHSFDYAETDLAAIGARRAVAQS